MKALKQRFSYDCGHSCLLHQGFKRPKIYKELNGKDIIDCSLGTMKIKLVDSIRQNGIYLMINKNNGKCHYISCLKNKVLDPSTGKLYHPKFIERLYRKAGWNVLALYEGGQHEA